MTNFHHFAGIGKMNCMPLNDFVNIVLFPIHVLINLIQKLGAYSFIRVRVFISRRVSNPLYYSPLMLHYPHQ